MMHRWCSPPGATECPLMCGSRASRRPSPKRLNANVAMASVTAGTSI